PPPGSNFNAIFRGNGGCNDTDSNSADFTATAANPRNTTSATHRCVNQPPTITNPPHPIPTVNANAPPFNGSLNANDDGDISNWSATPGTGVTSVTVASGQGTANISFTVTLQNGFTGTASFTATLSDNVNPAVSKTVHIQVNTVNNPPSITPPANPITTVEQNAAPFTVNVSGVDDGAVYNWSATPGTGVSLVSVTGGQGTWTGTFTVTLQGGFSGTATFTAILSDNVNAPATQAVNITVTPPPPPPNHLVISQIYGGGGNSGATYQNDFVEVYKPHAPSVKGTRWTIQHASAAGTSWTNIQPIGGVIGPGEYFLVSLGSGGANGAPLPTPNISGSINMGFNAGKVALVSNADPLAGCPVGIDSDIVDFV